MMEPLCLISNNMHHSLHDSYNGKKTVRIGGGLLKNFSACLLVSLITSEFRENMFVSFLLLGKMGFYSSFDEDSVPSLCGETV